MRHAEPVFVDTGAWIALALTRDPLHDRARTAWDRLLADGARPSTSVPVVLETFTFLERNAVLDVAIRWKDSLRTVPRLKVLPCLAADVERAWAYFRNPRLHKLSAIDAVSFALMTTRRIRLAFAFDTHFAEAGFRLIG